MLHDATSPHPDFLTAHAPLEDQRGVAGAGELRTAELARAADGSGLPVQPEGFHLMMAGELRTRTGVDSSMRGYRPI